MSQSLRPERMLNEYAAAPRMTLVFGRSGQTWQIPLSANFANRISQEADPVARLARANRRWRIRNQAVRQSWQAATVR